MADSAQQEHEKMAKGKLEEIKKRIVALQEAKTGKGKTDKAVIQKEIAELINAFHVAWKETDIKKKDDLAEQFIGLEMKLTTLGISEVADTSKAMIKAIKKIMPELQKWQSLKRLREEANVLLNATRDKLREAHDRIHEEKARSIQQAIEDLEKAKQGVDEENIKKKISQLKQVSKYLDALITPQDTSASKKQATPKKSDLHPKKDHDQAETSDKPAKSPAKKEVDPSSISDTFAKTAKLLQPGATGPTVRVETEDADSVGYYPYFKDKESQYKAGSKITIEIEVPNISPKDFAALQTALQETIDKNKSDTSFANKTGASFHKVYAGASIIPSAGNKFTFCIDKKSAFDVNLEEAVGMSLTFATKSPNAQAIAAAAGMISDTVGAYNKKSGVRVKQLIIQDYENDLVAGLAIYCSLAGQDKPVCFGDKGAAFNAAGKQNDKRVFDLLQELYKTPEGRDQLLHLVDDGHQKLTDMVQYAKANPGCTDAELANAAGIKHVPAPTRTPSPTSSEPHEPGPLELRPKPPK